MSDPIVAEADGRAIPIRLVATAELEAALAALAASQRAQVEGARFKGKAGEVALISDEGGLELALAGLGERPASLTLRALPAKLPPGFYALEPRAGGPAPIDAA